MKKINKGFTLVEMLIVVAIMAIILASVLPSLLSFRRSSMLNVETQEVITLINRARMLAVSSKNDQQFGVHFEAGKVVIFQGTTYTAGASTNEERVLNSALTGSTTVSGGGADILFAKVTGAADKVATTTLLIVGTTASTTILIRPSGVVTLN